MATLIELYKEIKRLEKDAKTAKLVHNLRKSKIWLRITKIRQKQDELVRDGVEFNAVTKFVTQEWDACFKLLEDEYSRYRDERKKRREEYERKLKEFDELFKKLNESCS
jgi:DNA-binding helix-hairpin-helix protein with protein kinase domain